MTPCSWKVPFSGQYSDGALHSAHITLMGGFLLTIDGVLVNLPLSSQKLIAFLALESRPVSRQYIACRLWPDTPETRAAGNLRSALWRIRSKKLPIIACYNECIALAPDIIVDVSEIVDMAKRLSNQDIKQLILDLDPHQFQGELLPDWYDDWLMLERERLHQICLHALETIGNLLFRIGRYGQAIDAALMAVSADPFRESAHLILIKTYLSEGNQRQAIEHYKNFSELMHRELQIAPTKDLQDLILSTASKHSA